jgi:GAF domain-containing protein
MPNPDLGTAPAQRGEGPTSRLVELSAVTAVLTRSSTLAEMSDIVTARAAAVLGADAAMIVLRDGPNQLRAHGMHGMTQEQVAEWSVFGLDREGPLGEAVLSGSIVWVRNRQEILARYPSLDDGTERASVTLPLLDRGGETAAIGAVAFRFDGRPVHLDADELAVLSVLADVCAQTVLRLLAQRERDEQQIRAQFLVDASIILASTLDYRETLTQVAGLAVPFHADWCAVEILEGGVLHTLAVAHVDPDKVALAREAQERWPSDPHDPGGAAEVARTGSSLLIEDVTDDMLVAAAKDADHLRIARELGLRSAISVPLRTHERVLGVITFVAAESGRRYTAQDVAFAEDLGRRAGVAIDNAELYSETRRVAAELQATLLPQTLPHIDGWELASAYHQSGRTEVGGDFYDVALLSDGRVAAVVGDVMGRGVDAAVSGSRLRAATHVLMSQDPAPSALATAVDRFLEVEPLTPLATAVYVLVDAAEDWAELVIAGHMPPLLVRADGTVEYVELARSPVLGIHPVVRDSSRFAFHRGDALILFTDGLVERRTHDIDHGLDLLAATVRKQLELGRWRQGRLGALIEEVTTRVMDSDRHDDVAVLALRRR